MKTCIKCKHEKDPTSFHNDRRRPDGLFPYCRECRGCKRIKPAQPHLTPSDQRYWRISDKYLHRVLMESHIGRKLEKGEVVHHKNENKHDNTIENLEIIDDREHRRHHYQQIKHKLVPKNYRLSCSICGNVFTARASFAKYCSSHCVYIAAKPRVQEWVRSHSKN